jgi:hypothetical protein
VSDNWLASCVDNGTKSVRRRWLDCCERQVTASKATGRPERAAPTLIDTQFEFINKRVKAFQRRGQPVISVDTKKKELIGDFKNGGREDLKVNLKNCGFTTFKTRRLARQSRGMVQRKWDERRRSLSY